MFLQTFLRGQLLVGASFSCCCRIWRRVAAKRAVLQVKIVHALGYMQRNRHSLKWDLPAGSWTMSVTQAHGFLGFISQDLDYAGSPRDPTQRGTRKIGVSQANIIDASLR